MMQKLVTDLGEIARLSKLREEENWRFRSFLKQEPISSHKLDQVVHSIYHKIESQIDCTQCGNCCRTFDIPVTEKDVKRLAKKVKIQLKDFKRDHLRESEDGPCFKTKPCSFLINNKCQHYDDRPSVCRSFPHLDKSNFLSRTMGVIGNAAICPIVFNVWEELKAWFKTSGIRNND